MTPDRHLAATSARGASFYAALALIVLVETAAVHLWLHARHERLAWGSTVLGLLTLGWLFRDWRGRSDAGLDLGPTMWRLRIPGRVTVDIPLAHLAAVTRPSWRDLPAPDASGYLDAARPLDPNLLLELREPVSAHLPLGLRRTVRVIGVHLREPEQALAERATRLALNPVSDSPGRHL